MDPEKSLNFIFPILNMESPKVQKVSHWLSKHHKFNVAAGNGQKIPLDCSPGTATYHSIERLLLQNAETPLFYYRM